MASLPPEPWQTHAGAIFLKSILGNGIGEPYSNLCIHGGWARGSSTLTGAGQRISIALRPFDCVR